MSVDLKGNTNFAYLKNLNGDLVVPRTNLAAVDITTANGLAVTGNTMYAVLATADDITNGTSGSLVAPNVLKPFLDNLVVTLSAGDGILVDGYSISVNEANTTELLTGDSNAAKKAVDVEALHGALSTGKAVDVTSAPSASAGTLTYATDLRGTITWATTAAGTAKIGFYDNSTKFPKFASGLAYILMADVKNTSSAAVTLTYGGTAVNEAAGEIAAGATKRVAMLFTTATTGYFSFTAAVSTTLEITNLREFEVTGCTDEARKYIAALSNPDDFTKFYLVDYDEQNPWTYIIDMGNSPAVTLMAGLSYKLDATAGTHTLTTDTCPVGYNGEDAHLTLFVGLTGNVVFQSPLNLIDPLTPGAGHNITVKFRDGQANAYVDDTDIGYVITVNSGTASGSLYYALTTATENYAVFAAGTDNTPVNLEGVVAAQGAKNVVGNGYEKTTITGSGAFTSKTVFTNVSMDGVVVTGGTMTLGDAFIPSGSTVAVSGGGLAVEKVTGNGGVVDLGGTHVVISGGTAYASGCVFSGGSAEAGGAFFANLGALNFVSCNFKGNAAGNNGGAVYFGNTLTMDHCTVSGNTATVGQGLYGNGGNATLTNCSISNNIEIRYNGKIGLNGGNTVAGVILNNMSQQDLPSVTLSGSNTVGRIAQGNQWGSGTVTISSGAVIDLTNNANATPINPGGGITFEPGGATVLYSSGAVSGSYMMDNVTLPAGAKLTNTAAVNLNSKSIRISSGATAYASGCTFSGGYAEGGGVLYGFSGSVLSMNNCIVTGNSGATGYNATGVDIRGNAVFVSCAISGNTSIVGDIKATSGGVAVFDNSNVGRARVMSNGQIHFVNNNEIELLDYLVTSGTVVISSGASINLTSGIAPGGTGGITVLEGGCTVNGNAIPAGTYTSIDSTGTPT